MILIRTSLFLLVSMLTLQVSGQSADQKKLYRKARREFEKNRIEKAVKLYQELVNTSPGNCEYNYGLGEAYYYWDEVKVQCIPYLEKALTCVGEENNDPDIYFFLADCYHLTGQYQKAIAHFAKYLELLEQNGDFLPAKETARLKNEITQRMWQCQNAELLQKLPETKLEINGEQKSFAVELMNDVNSVSDDYSCVLGPGDTILYFASRKQGSSGEETDYWDDKIKEDIYYSIKQDGKWGSAKNIGEPINTKKHEAPDCLSPDGKKLYFYRGIKQGTVYISEKKGKGGWDKPVQLPKGKNVNTPSWETSFNFVINDNTVYFSSGKKGGYGGRDLYRSTRNDDGTWSLPENLGPEINTPYDEDAPFVSVDGTLYFSSTGHNSMGGFDVFSSKMLNGKWSKPQNLGLQVNSAGDDIYFVLDSKMEFAYYASNRRVGDRNDLNLYQVSIEKKKDTVVLASDITKDKDLPVKTDTIKTVPVVPEVKFGNVLFGLENYTISESYFAQLDELAVFLKNNPSAKLSLEGYTDITGSDSYNEKLSEKRAGEIKKYLVKKGIGTERILVSAKGKQKPAADNGTREGRIQNRRVEITIIR